MRGVEPWAYLTDVIQRLAENPDENLEDLLPYNWKVKYPQRTPAEIMASLPTPKVAYLPCKIENAHAVDLYNFAQ